MSTVINEGAIKEMKTLTAEMKTAFEEFLLEDTLATGKQVISSAKRARALSGKLGKMHKEYRKLSLTAFDKDPATKKKAKEKRDKRKAEKGSDSKATTKTSKKKKKK